MYVDKKQVRPLRFTLIFNRPTLQKFIVDVRPNDIYEAFRLKCDDRRRVFSQLRMLKESTEPNTRIKATMNTSLSGHKIWITRDALPPHVAHVVLYIVRRGKKQLGIVAADIRIDVRHMQEGGLESPGNWESPGNGTVSTDAAAQPSFIQEGVVPSAKKSKKQRRRERKTAKDETSGEPVDDEEREASYSSIEDSIQSLRIDSARATSSDLPISTPADGEDELCVICWERKYTHTCVPCGHMCACKECGDKLIASHAKCPVCREEVAIVMQVFRV